MIEQNEVPASPAIAETRTPSRIADFYELSKPGIMYLALVTTFVGYILAPSESFNIWLLVHTFLGTAFVAAGGGALNMVMEYDADTLMNRTKNRPIPAGRISYAEGLLFGITSSSVGIVYLLLFVNPLASVLGALTIGGYLFVYTPSKKFTSLSTIIGSFPGAVPPLIGWAAVRNELSLEAWILFAIQYFWQIPHFLAIAWMYRKDYERAGFPMLPVIEPTGATTSTYVVVHCLALIPVSVLPFFFQLSGVIYFTGALALGIVFLLFGILLMKEKTNANAKRLLLASIFYFPLLLGFLFIDKGLSLF
ncbi:MAG: heme o synthase [Ignavibacteriales bacterium]|nr:heme o synthase [Ignavibacteriales bacterium]